MKKLVEKKAVAYSNYYLPVSFSLIDSRFYLRYQPQN